MGVEFTKDQQKVIDLRDCNILVAAAAGSGKTAVLVERIITRLTKDKPAMNVDELLVVTFTEAAAAEMKERVRNAIEKALEENPDDTHLQRQATLIHSAQITTIHSFCLSVIREYFYKIDLDPSFRTAEDSELELMKQDVLNELLETYYTEGNADFIEFVESYATGKDDKKIGELILQLYRFSIAYPSVEKWIEQCIEKYTIVTPQELEESQAVVNMMEYTISYMEDMKKTLAFLLDICENGEGPKEYIPAIKEDLQQLSLLCKTTGFVDMQQTFQGMVWGNLTACKDKQISKVVINFVKDTRNDIKKNLIKLQEDFFSSDIEKTCIDIQNAKGNMVILTKLLKDFMEGYAQKKRSKNIIDFNDMEHMALQILTEEKDGDLVPSQVAKEYQKRYKEIMIDEYQDSSLVQEAILTSVSRNTDNGYNIFMVGDVKQSIYRFRLARPELFMKKFYDYSLDGGNEQRVDLHKNFRSRKEVLASTNFVFEQIMTRQFGGIEYDENAKLNVGAEYAPQEGNETEILLLDEREIEGSKPREVEALVVAKRIKELMKNHKLAGKEPGEFRPVRYRDIVILTRDAEGWTDVYSRVLNQEGIPTYAVSKAGYFGTLEITMMLNFLKTLDNPRQDIPFVAVLTSELVGITKEELVKIKIETDGSSFYDRAKAYIVNGADKELIKKLDSILKEIDELREMVPYTSIYELLNLILEQYGYADYFAALPGGEQRTANVEMLLQQAESFEKTSYKGVFHFVRYVEQLKKHNVDYGEANLAQEDSDVVQLMTIHKSKGLEFPIVFVGGMGKHFGKNDIIGSVVMHSRLGIGLDAINYEERTMAPTLLKKIIKQEIVLDNAAEEMRILYVAMTRAKEKLIMVGSVSDLQKKLAPCEELKDYDKRQLSYGLLTRANSYFDWVIPAVYRHMSMSSVLDSYGFIPPSFNALYREECPLLVRKVTVEDLVLSEVEEQLEKEISKEKLENWDADRVYDQETKEYLVEQGAFCYPYQWVRKLPQTMSVSELKKRAYEEEIDTQVLFREEEVFPLLPKFLQEETELTGASRGTAYHRVMELLDFTSEHSLKTINEALQKMAEQGFIKADMVSCIDARSVLTFLQSPIGTRMHAAAKQGKLQKEKAFVLGVDAKEVYPQMESDERILVEGIIDAFFEEDGYIVVVDYKTDKVKNANELRERYEAQLSYYAKALEQLTGKSVKQKVIYSLTLQEEIEV